MTTDNRLIFLYYLCLFKFLDRFRIGGVPRGIRSEKSMDGNREKLKNCPESAESKSQ